MNEAQTIPLPTAPTSEQLLQTLIGMLKSRKGRELARSILARGLTTPLGRTGLYDELLSQVDPQRFPRILTKAQQIAASRLSACVSRDLAIVAMRAWGQRETFDLPPTAQVSRNCSRRDLKTAVAKANRDAKEQWSL